MYANGQQVDLFASNEYAHARVQTFFSRRVDNFDRHIIDNSTM